MDQYPLHLNTRAAYEEVRSSLSVSMFDGREKEMVVCPKPRRFPQTGRPLRWHHSQLADPYESRAGADLLDIILPKGGADQLSSSPPFFCGSPPSRVSNPLIQDARFGDEKLSPISPIPSNLSSPSSRKGGCIRANFGNNPSVRIEGFDSLDRDRRNCSIPALA